MRHPGIREQGDSFPENGNVEQGLSTLEWSVMGLSRSVKACLSQLL